MAAKDENPMFSPFDTDDFELDFDMEDFDLGFGEDEPGEPQGRVMKPRIDIKSATKKVCFSYAKEFAKQVDLSPGARTYAWVDGSFIFGDIIEALVVERLVLPEEIYISSLSISQENIDSLKTLILTGYVKKLTIILSAYFYSHEKFDLIPYLYEELDIGDILQVVFINCHAKIIAIKTKLGNTLTIHGSANLRSSNSIEQIMAERDPDFYEFNARIMDELGDRFGTINHAIPHGDELQRHQNYRHRKGKELWRAVATSAARVGAVKGAAKHMRDSDGQKR